MRKQIWNKNLDQNWIDAVWEQNICSLISASNNLKTIITVYNLGFKEQI